MKKAKAKAPPKKAATEFDSYELEQQGRQIAEFSASPKTDAIVEEEEQQPKQAAPQVKKAVKPAATTQKPAKKPAKKEVKKPAKQLKQKTVEKALAPEVQDKDTGIHNSLDNGIDAAAAMETAAFLNHQEVVAERSASRLGPAQALEFLKGQQQAAEDEGVIRGRLSDLTAKAASNFVDVANALNPETSGQLEIERLMAAATDPADTKALADAATRFRTDDEVGDEIRAQSVFGRKQVHAELKALQSGQMDSLFRQPAAEDEEQPLEAAAQDLSKDEQLSVLRSEQAELTKRIADLEGNERPLE